MGWLETVVDAEGTAHSYVHNGAGKVVADKYSRTKADGTITNEAISYSYDAYGLLTGQSVATRLTGGPNPTYSFGDSTNIKYNTYGEMTGRGINTDINGNTAYQETFDYDEGGRLWRTTSGDGAIKIMLRDVLGNVTLTMSSTGANLAALTPPASEHKFTDTLPNLALATNGDTGLAGAVTTIAVFDKRGQQTATIEPDRQLKAGSPNETISRSRAFNAFGEVTSETDARNNTTEFLYNSMGRLVEKRSPLVVWTDQYGTQHLNERPIEKYRYDVAGRMIATVDAAGFETRRHLLAGTGHAGSEAQVTTEFHADGGKAQILYDQFGDARIKRNEYWVDANSDLTKTDVLMKYDKRGRLSEVQHLGRLLTETFVYDVLDQRTRRTMDRHDGGADLTEYTEYDRQGRVASRTDFGNDLTTYSYVWHGEFSTGPLGNLGGWLKKTTDAAGRDATESTDYFDHTIAREDFGDNAYSYSFDAGGRLTAQTVGSETTSYSYLNTGRLSTISNGVGSSTAYGYDAAGNETSEVTYKSGALVQNAVATFDALDRMASWQELGTSTLPAASILYEYDRVGNIRRQKSSFQRLDGHGQPGSPSHPGQLVPLRFHEPRDHRPGVPGRPERPGRDRDRRRGARHRQYPAPASRHTPTAQQSRRSRRGLHLRRGRPAHVDGGDPGALRRRADRAQRLFPREQGDVRLFRRRQPVADALGAGRGAARPGLGRGRSGERHRCRAVELHPRRAGPGHQPDGL